MRYPQHPINAPPLPINGPGLDLPDAGGSSLVIELPLYIQVDNGTVTKVSEANGKYTLEIAPHGPIKLHVSTCVNVEGSP